MTLLRGLRVRALALRSLGIWISFLGRMRTGGLYRWGK